VKKIVALLLALLMVFSLFACAKEEQAAPSASPSAASSPSPAETPSPTESTAPGGSPGAAAGAIGYITDEVDHSARDTYKLAYFYYAALTLEKAHFDAMQKMQDRLNIEVTDFSANDNADMFIQNLETASTQGFDGYIIEPNADIHARIFEVATELEIPFIYTVNAYRDETGANLVPTIILDQYKNGNTQVQWFLDHFNDYWPTAEAKDIALMSLEFSSNPDLALRSAGVKDKFAELFPGNPSYVGDMAGQKIDAQIAYDQVAAILTAHPEVKYWFINGAIENFGQGAARAAEGLAKEDIILIVTSGANVLPLEWDAGYEGSWVASYAVFNYNYVVPALCGLIALIDGRATPETLWAEVRAPGDKATAYVAGDQMVTIDTYKTVMADIEKSFGIS
jgi:ABC-type sugar transport system substrate-binding protein